VKCECFTKVILIKVTILSLFEQCPYYFGKDKKFWIMR